MSRTLHVLLRVLVIAGASALATGCGGDGNRGGESEVDELRVGGSVGYCKLSSFVYLPGAAVTLAGFEDDVMAAVSGSGGLWEIEGVPEGVYTLGYSLAGYEPWSTAIVVAQPVGSPSLLVDTGLACLDEVLATASIAPFGVTLVNGQDLVDGTAGQTLSLSKSANAPIVLTFDRTLPGFALGGPPPTGPRIRTVPGNLAIYASADVTHTIYTFSDAQLDGVNGGAGLNTGGFLQFLEVDVVQYEPMNGGRFDFEGSLRFQVTP